MKKWLFRIVWIPVLLLAVLFLVANRTLVPISLDPFRPDNPAMSTPALPLWFWLMGMLFIGVALGAAGRRQHSYTPKSWVRETTLTKSWQ